MANLTAGIFFDKLSTISTALNLGVINPDSYPTFRRLLIEVAAHTYTEWYKGMSFSELKSRVIHCEHKPLQDWQLVDLVDDVVEYYWDDFEDDYDFETEEPSDSNLLLLAIEVNQMFSPIEWAKINSGIVNAQLRKEA